MMRHGDFALSSILLLVMGACGGPADLGGACDPAQTNGCKETLVCDASDKTCRKPAGATCDPSAKDRQCVATAVCEGSGTSGTCGLAKGASCDPANTSVKCAGDLICAPLEAGGNVCAKKCLLVGHVFDALTPATKIKDALLIALDSVQTPVTDVFVSASDGAFEVALELPRQNSDGKPVSRQYTLRASAKNYATFPGGLRQALPIDTALATDQDKGWVIASTLTEIGLIPLPTAQQGQATLKGNVTAATKGGVLVVAKETTSGKGYSGLSDRAGAFTIFNVPDGAYEVRGYKASVQLTPTNATVTNKTDVTGLVLGASSDALATVSGTVQIVAGGVGPTSVVFLVEATFDPVFMRGEAPAGLRAPAFGPPDVDNGETWTVTGVPDGNYVVLAAFENDNLVRDESGIGGTAITHITVPDATTGKTITIPGFKVTQALAVVSPGATGPEAVTTATPTFTWKDVAGEDTYDVVVYNALGEKIWETNIAKVTGATNASVPYGGTTALVPGMYYQFRAASKDNASNVLNRTEDLLGVFYLQ